MFQKNGRVDPRPVFLRLFGRPSSLSGKTAYNAGSRIEYRHRERDRRADIQTDKQTQADIQTDRQRLADRRTERQAGRQTERQANKQTDRQTNRQTVWQIGKKAGS